MRMLIRRTMIAGLVLVSLVAAFYAGAFVGFTEGRAVQLGRSASTDALWISHALTALRSDRQQDALSILESQLDSALLSHGVHVLAGPPRFDLTSRQPIEGFKLLRPAAAYRSEHPAVSENPEVRATITGISSCLSEMDLEGSEGAVRTALQACYRGVW